LSFPRKRETREINEFWTPAFAGVTDLGTFYEFINNGALVKNQNFDGKEKSSSFPPIAGFPLLSNKRANPEE